MVQPYSRNWSLELVDDVVYTTTARGCGGSPAQPVEYGTVAAMDVSDPTHPSLSRFYTGKGRPAGPWGASGVAWGPQGAYVSTADGPNNPGSGVYGDMVLAIRPHAWGLNDSFIPDALAICQCPRPGFRFGRGAAVSLRQAQSSLATASKESVIYLLDADNLGGVDHMTALYQSPRLGNDTQDFQARACGAAWPLLWTTRASAGSISRCGARPAKAGPKFAMTNGDAPNGSIMAFKVEDQGGKPVLQPQWISRDLNLASPPVVANGVVYALQTAESAVQVPKGIFNADGSRKPWTSDAGRHRPHHDAPRDHDPVRLRCDDRQGIMVQQEGDGRQHGALHPAGGGAGQAVCRGPCRASLGFRAGALEAKTRLTGGQKNREAAGCFRAVTASHCPLQTGPPDPDPTGPDHSRGFPKRPSAAALTVPQTGLAAMVLRGFTMLCGAMWIFRNNCYGPGLEAQPRKCLESFRPWR